MHKSFSKMIIGSLSIIMVALLVHSCTKSDWRTARRDSANLAPDAESTQDAVVMVFGARTFGWRGWFAIHPWIAVKRTDEASYRVIDVVGWRENRNQLVMQIREDIPDRYWYGAKPEILQSYQGEGVDQLIDKIELAAESYPWKTTYKAFPGPNSNTFVSWVAKQVPELDLDLPITAIGQGYVKKHESQL